MVQRNYGQIERIRMNSKVITLNRMNVALADITLVVLFLFLANHFFVNSFIIFLVSLFLLVPSLLIYVIFRLQEIYYLNRKVSITNLGSFTNERNYLYKFRYSNIHLMNNDGIGLLKKIREIDRGVYFQLQAIETVLNVYYVAKLEGLKIDYIIGESSKLGKSKLILDKLGIKLYRRKSITEYIFNIFLNGLTEIIVYKRKPKFKSLISSTYTFVLNIEWLDSSINMKNLQMFRLRLLKKLGSSMGEIF